MKIFSFLLVKCREDWRDAQGQRLAAALREADSHFEPGAQPKLIQVIHVVAVLLFGPYGIRRSDLNHLYTYAIAPIRPSVIRAGFS